MQPMDGHRRIRQGAGGGVLAAAAVGLLLVGSASPGVAAGVSPAPASDTNSLIAVKQAEAAQIAATLNGEAIRLAEMSQRLDGAQVQADRVSAELATTQRRIAITSAWLGATRSVLRRQAVEAYILGGRPPVVSLKGPGGADDLLTRQGYAASVAAIERDAIRQLHALSGQLVDSQTALAVEKTAAQAAVVQIRQDETAAAAASAAEQATLAQVEGEVATLVHAQQAQEAAAEEAQLKAEFARPAVSQASPAVPATPSTVPSRRTAPSTSTSVSRSTTTVAAAPVVRSVPVIRSVPVVVATPATTPTTLTFSPSSSLPRTTSTRATTTQATSPRVTSPRVTSRRATALRATSPPARPAPSPPAPPKLGPPAPPPPPGNAPAPGWQIALAYARAQLGKPYLWGGAGPNSFDCSGLTMMAWRAAGVALDHYAPDQWAATRRVAIADLQPGDLVFYGFPAYHVGLYVGGGVMIEAPSTGQLVQYHSIYFRGLYGGGRVY